MCGSSVLVFYFYVPGSSPPVQILFLLGFCFSKVYFTKVYWSILKFEFFYLGKTFEGSCGGLGVSAHSDFGMVTLLLTDGIPCLFYIVNYMILQINMAQSLDN